jgi:hypothetical protein
MSSMYGDRTSNARSAYGRPRQRDKVAASTRGYCSGRYSPPSGASPSSRISQKARGVEVFLADAHDWPEHGRQRLHPGQRLVHAALARVVGEDDQVGLALALGGLALQHGVDRNVVLGQDGRDARQHAGLIGHLQPQVERGHHLLDRQDRRRGQRVGLECQVWHAVIGVGGVQPGDVDQVGHHCRGRRLRAGAFAVVERRADGVALHDHGVHRALDVGDQPPGRHQRRVHAQLDALGAAPRDAEQLDAVSELFGIADVDCLQCGDALHVGLVELHRHAEGDGAHDGGLVRGVDALDVEGRVGLGVSQPLSLLEHDAEVEALVAHLAEDEVGRAVDDAGDPLDTIGGQPLAQRLDDRDAAGHRGLEADHHSLGVRGGEDLVAVHREQRLVGGDHMLAGGNRLHHERARDAVAADQLDDDVDCRIGDDLARIVDHADTLADNRPYTGGVEVGDRRDLEAAPGAAPDLLLVAAQHLEGATADGADAEQADLDRLGFDVGSRCDPGLRRNGWCCHVLCLLRN